MKVLKRIGQNSVRLFITVMVVFSVMAGFTTPAFAAPQNTNGAVYTLSNAAGGNEVLVYERSANGALAFQGSYPTGGLGRGAGLGSQGWASATC